MGSPKFPKKKYDTPLHPWKEDRIESERELIKKYGLKNHKEVWKAKTHLGRYRQQARELLAKIGGKNPQTKKESEQLLLHLTRIGILPEGSSLDDVLALETESILSRRLQTLVYLKGFSNTATQSRQLINHGHIAIGGRKVTIPGYIVTKEEENDIGYTSKSPLNELSHPARPKTDVFKGAEDKKIEKTEEVSTESKEEREKKERTGKKEKEITKPTKKYEEETKEDKKTKEETGTEKPNLKSEKEEEKGAPEKSKDKQKTAPVKKEEKTDEKKGGN